MNSRRKFIKTSAASVASVSFLPLGLPKSSVKSDNSSGNKVKLYHRFIAIDNVCAWPNLTVLNDGTIIATIFNQPSHGGGEGDVECWASKDGHFWEKRGTPARHTPGTNRMNVAAGLSKNGDLIVIASGWELKKDSNSGSISLVEVLRPWVSRSNNGGQKWEVNKNGFPLAAEGMTEYIPFGDIAIGKDGSLRVLAYAQSEDKVINALSIFRSDDDGKNWKLMSAISDGKGETAFCGGHNETAFFYIGSGNWIAAARRWKEGAAIDLFRSKDDGISWELDMQLTEPRQHPGHILKLNNGTLLLTYGNRIKENYGVAVKTSQDNGVTWGEEYRVVDDFHPIDGGYPASVQLPDGNILTAYYARSVDSHYRYHMGVAVWNFIQ
ncbi:exo-alpha-sialidase [Mariniphaga sediminis]|uniref:Exo-alpha-sialidase n=1 Tax=Mariniphaga sediminis TaxID=1628158 RepID=A0A399D1W5_9BACT|nr:sialidase family protein [Mariniphaga sediminis]RIH65567.1 exo-alpha-sialidase [Mariniphaga sediminis]